MAAGLPLRTNKAIESRCRMAAAHGISKTPVAAHESSSAARSHKLAQLCIRSSRHQRDRTLVWIGKTKEVWTRYGILRMNQARSGTGIGSIQSIYARLASQESTGLQSWCPTSISAIADDNFRVGDLVLWRRPG